MGGNAPEVTGEYPDFDDTPAGVAAANLYGPCVAAVARSFEYDFARSQENLTTTGNAGPFPMGFTREYRYPAAAVEIWQVIDADNDNLNNPLPTNWVVGNAVVNGVQRRVIWTSVTSAKALINNNPLPSVWDDLFRETVVRRLASEFAMALAGRPETEANLLQSSGATAAVAQSRDG